MWKIKPENEKTFRVFHGFVQAKFSIGSSILGLSQFLQLSQAFFKNEAHYKRNQNWLVNWSSCYPDLNQWNTLYRLSSKYKNQKQWFTTLFLPITFKKFKPWQEHKSLFDQQQQQQQQQQQHLHFCAKCMVELSNNQICKKTERKQI